MKKLFLMLALLLTISSALAQDSPHKPEWVDLGVNDHGDRYQVDKNFIKISNQERREIVIVQRILFAAPRKLLPTDTTELTSIILFTKIQCRAGKSQALVSVLMNKSDITGVEPMMQSPSIPTAGSIESMIVGELCGDGA